MRNSLFWIAILLVGFARPTNGAPGDLPMISSVEPQSGKAGDLLTARGASLGPESVAAVYLTDGKADFKTTILEQSAVTVKFKIPQGVKPGRFALMVLTSGPDARLIEEPVKVTIEADTTARSGIGVVNRASR